MKKIGLLICVLAMALTSCEGPMGPPGRDGEAEYVYMPQDSTYATLYSDSDFQFVDSILREGNPQYFKYKPMFWCSFFTSMITLSISLFFEKHFHIIFNSAYTGNPEVLHENIRHVRRQEGWKRRSEVNILHSQIQ